MKHDVNYLKEESYQLIGAAFEVYNDRGFGLAEELYQECMEIELELRGIAFRAKQELACIYKGRELKKSYIPDLLVFGSIVVELKAFSQLLPEHEGSTSQLHAHHKATVGTSHQLRQDGRFGLQTHHPLGVPSQMNVCVYLRSSAVQ